MHARQALIVVRGAGPSRAHLAHLLATALPGPVAHVQGDDLADRWILRGLVDQQRQAETVYRLLRLTVVSYLKDGFSVVVDAPFAVEVDGHAESRAQEARDLIRLAHTFRDIATGVVTLDPPPGAGGSPDAALPDDTLDGEVRVVPDLTADESSAAGAILERLDI